MKKNKLIKKVTIFVLIIIFCGINLDLTYAYNDMSFKNITIEDGLSQSSVNTLYQDTNGYMWIGTNDGLNRYNGYDFKVYSYNDKDKNSISNNFIIDVTEDNSGNIWVGTANGLSKINLKTGNINNYLDRNDNGNLSHYNIRDILVTKDNRIIVATSNGLNLYDKENDKFKRVLSSENQLTNQMINSLTEDEKGNIWIGTDKGLDKYDANFKNRLEFYQNKGKNSISESSINKVYYEKENIWLGTSNSGLIKINISNNEITRYSNNLDNKNSLPGNRVNDIMKDSRGNLWICTNQGLAKYNYNADNFITYSNEIYDKTSLIANDVISIIEDKSGVIWLGTYAGISMFDPNNEIQHYKTNPSDKNSINSNLIQGIYEDNEGLLWVGTNSKGINIIDREKNIIRRIDKEHNDFTLSDYSINDITGKDDYIYIATDNGLNVLNKKTKKVEKYFKENNIANNNIKSLFLDKRGYLWIGTIDGISVLNTNDNTIKDCTYLLKKINKNDTYVSSIYEDEKGYLYIGLFLQGGLIRLNLDTHEYEVYKTDKSKAGSISSNSIKDIKEDSYGNMWIGTRYGLNKFNPKNKTFKVYTTKEGLPNNTVYGILFDKKNNPWVSTNLGIAKLDIKSNKFQTLGVADGLQSNEFNSNASYENKNGEFFFGGINGLNVFYPEDIKKSNFVGNVEFDEFNINGKNYQDINMKKFASNENNISISFFLTSYKDVKKTQYYYKLEHKSNPLNLYSRKDSDWNRTYENTVVFSDLDSGDYTFKVVSRNDNGNFSEQSSINFTIKKPCWISNIALAIYAVIIIIIIYMSINRMKKLDRLVEKRTYQLKNEMEKNNNLLNKVIILEKNKNNYFVNLSHELRTPLNVINSTRQLISELNKKEQGISKEKISHYMDVIDKNSKRLLNLINNIIDSTKLQNGQYMVQLEKHDIVYIVEETVLGLRDFIENKGIEFIIDPEIEEKIIECDRYEIERCIVNLIGNAVKFTPRGGKIEIKIKDLNDKVMISVKDNGIGIEKKFHESIFNRFNQVVDANSEVKGGSGLGLTITKQIIELHRGTIYVESEVGKGSEFIIILPGKVK